MLHPPYTAEWSNFSRFRQAYNCLFRYEISQEQDRLISILEQGTYAQDSLVRDVAATALARIVPDHPRLAVLHDVAKKEGRPGIMPTISECKKHAPNPVTIGSIITRSTNPNPKKPPRSWFEVSQLCGLKYVKGVHRVTLQFIRSFVKSLGDALYSLSPSEIYVLFE